MGGETLTDLHSAFFAGTRAYSCYSGTSRARK